MKSSLNLLSTFFFIPSYAWSGEGITCDHGDEVTISYYGAIEEGPLDEGSLVVVIGKGNTMPGFDEELVGLQQEEEKTFSVTLPDDYPAMPIGRNEIQLANKNATFKVKIKKIIKK